jgi:hypothetical protein
MCYNIVQARLCIKKEGKMVEDKENVRKNKAKAAPIKIFGTDPKHPEEGRIFLWTKAGWFERIEDRPGDLTFTYVAQSEIELRQFINRDEPSVDLVQLGSEYRKKTAAEFTGDLEIYYATEREKRNRSLTGIGISLVILGLFILGAGIYFRSTYNPVNFKSTSYQFVFSQAFSAGLSAIIVGMIMHVFGWAILGLTYLRHLAD